jgi:hypothetical protein
MVCAVGFGVEWGLESWVIYYIKSWICLKSQNQLDRLREFLVISHHPIEQKKLHRKNGLLGIAEKVRELGLS